jgi:hypothetical protein
MFNFTDHQKTIMDIAAIIGAWAAVIANELSIWMPIISSSLSALWLLIRIWEWYTRRRVKVVTEEIEE